MEGQLVEPKKAQRRKTKNNVIAKSVIKNLVGEICTKNSKKMIWTTKALQALHESCEDMLQKRFMKAQRYADMCKVQTVCVEHWTEADPDFYV